VVVAKGAATFMLRGDGRAVYVLRQRPELDWEIATLDVASGVEKQRTALGLDSGTVVAGARLHPDGTLFVVSATVFKRDIWILSGLKGGGILDFWRRWTRAPDDEGVRH
jgi:hypothetical protein